MRCLRDLEQYDPARSANNIFPGLAGLARNEISRVLAREGRCVSLDALWALGRFFRAAVRPRLVGPLAIAAGIALIPCAVKPGLAISLVLWFCCGLCCAYQVQAAASFVQATPDSERAQAYGFAGAGLIAVQGIGVVLFGLVASALNAHRAVALAAAIAAALGVALIVASHRRLVDHAGVPEAVDITDTWTAPSLPPKVNVPTKTSISSSS